MRRHRGRPDGVFPGFFSLRRQRLKMTLGRSTVHWSRHTLRNMCREPRRFQPPRPPSPASPFKKFHVPRKRAPLLRRRFVASPPEASAAASRKRAVTACMQNVDRPTTTTKRDALRYSRLHSRCALQMYAERSDRRFDEIRLFLQPVSYMRRTNLEERVLLLCPAISVQFLQFWRGGR